jgi:DNA-binding transcriptional ArsR family regulator
MSRSEQDDAWATLARMVSNPLRSHVLFKYAEAVTSPSAVAAALGAKLNLVSYHTSVLRDAGVLELVRTERRRGAAKHFYRATLSSVIDDAGWEALPTGLRRALARRVIDGASREAADALSQGGMDAASTHLSRSYFVLDDQGRDELDALLEANFATAAAIDTTSRARGDEGAVPCELVMMSFERASSP